MKKFKITATLHTTRTITRTIEAETRNKATAMLLLDTNLDQWKVDNVLKTNTK